MASLTLPLIFFIVYIIINLIPRVGRIMAYSFIFLTYLFALANVRGLSDQAIFYSLALLFVFSVFISNTFSIFNKGQLFDNKLVLLQLFSGVIVIFALRVLQTSAGGVSILGVPRLAASPGLSIPGFELVAIGLLAFVENAMAFLIFILLFHALRFIPLPFLNNMISRMTFAGVIAAFIMALFHLFVYSLNIGSLIWAWFAFMLFIFAYNIPKFGGSLVADTAHFWWNVLVSASRTLAIAF